MTITFSKIFKAAHKDAKVIRSQYDSYREAFRVALRRVWANVRRIQEAAREVNTILHFQGNNNKSRSRIEWKLGQMLTSVSDREAAKKYAKILRDRRAFADFCRGAVRSTTVNDKIAQYNTYCR